MIAVGAVKLKSADTSIVSHKSVIVHLTVALPPAHKSGMLTEALSLVNTGEHPFAMANALVCVVTQLAKAAFTAAWSAKSQDCTFSATGAL